MKTFHSHFLYNFIQNKTNKFVWNSKMACEYFLFEDFSSATICPMKQEKVKKTALK